MVGVMVDNPDWRRLGEYVTRRREQLGMTQADVDAAKGPSVATLRKIEKGGAPEGSYRGGVLASLERALQWPNGAVDRILAGSEPDINAEPIVSRPDLVDDQLVQYEVKLTQIRDDDNRSPGIRAWARTLLAQIEEIYAADAAEAKQRKAS
jgi:transcriptional regulator with XRE-family HTH domain